MRILIAEDDETSRKFLDKTLSRYGDCDLVVDGLETIEACLMALKTRKYYGLICLDIMMPKLDGVKALESIIDLETRQGLLPEKRAKILMITALTEAHFVHKAFDIGCDAYAAKPLDIAKIDEAMQKLGISKIAQG